MSRKIVRQANRRTSTSPLALRDPRPLLAGTPARYGARRRPRKAAILLPLAAVVAWARLAQATCNVIPGTTQTFRASQTTVDRPFAVPGDFVTLGLDPTCYALERTFSTNPSDQVVTVVFTPPQGGPRNVVVLAPRCAGIGTGAGGASTTCFEAN